MSWVNSSSNRVDAFEHFLSPVWEFAQPRWPPERLWTVRAPHQTPSQGGASRVTTTV